MDNKPQNQSQAQHDYHSSIKESPKSKKVVSVWMTLPLMQDVALTEYSVVSRLRPPDRTSKTREVGTTKARFAV